MSETPKPCPNCHAGPELQQWVANSIRCGACGFQYNVIKDVISEQARQRKEQGFRGFTKPPK